MTDLPNTCQTLVIVLGDQCDQTAAWTEWFDPAQDCLWMAEVTEESQHVWSHKQRIALFLSVMRHFRAYCTQQGWPMVYHPLDAPDTQDSLAKQLAEDLAQIQPKRVCLVKPGDWRVEQSLITVINQYNLTYEILPDTHFLSTPEAFSAWAKGRKELRLEYFYRWMRQQNHILMDGQKPVGDQWNFDKDNRGSFGQMGPLHKPALPHYPPDAITQAVLQLVETRFENHPGSLTAFSWPVTPEEAAHELADFITHRLPFFGDYQDAMWTDEPFLFHSRLSAALNLKLIHPMTVIQAAQEAYHNGHASLNAVEGFIRQILGWREYVRGLYWHHMPTYVEQNYFQATAALPDFYWTGKTDMHCLHQVISQTLQYGYAHHIQRLMVTGLFTLLAGIDPKAVHEWYLAVYVDAVEWVELPNTLGMSQYADGGIMASKPYVATGKYIQRMSNYCQSCIYDPAEATGPKACPFTTLYWDFLERHKESLKRNHRMGLQLKNLDRLEPEKLRQIQHQGNQYRQTVCQ